MLVDRSFTNKALLSTFCLLCGWIAPKLISYIRYARNKHDITSVDDEHLIENKLKKSVTLLSSIEETEYYQKVSFSVTRRIKNVINEITLIINLLEENNLYSDDSDEDSFISANENLEDQTFKYTSSFPLMESAIEILSNSRIECRIPRTKLVNCRNDDEYLAKLHVIREGFNSLFKDFPNFKSTIINDGRRIGSAILQSMDTSDEYFVQYYDILIDYLEEVNPEQLSRELKTKKIPVLNFFDIFLDYTMTDALEKLSNPPESIKSIAQNYWISEGIKRRTMTSSAWAIMYAKKKILENQDGFLAKYYDLLGTFIGPFAWAFLGTDERLKLFYSDFKDLFISYVTCIFTIFPDEELKPEFLSGLRYHSKSVFLIDLQSQTFLTLQLVKEKLGEFNKI